MHRWPCDAAGLIVPGSFVLIPKSTCTTWESVDPNAKETVGLGFFVHLAGGIRVPSWWELCHQFSWVWIFNPKWIQHTQAGHLGKLWCRLHNLLPWPWIYLGVPDPPSEACMFCKCIIPIRRLKSCRLEAALCQQTLEEPNSSWQHSR